MSKGGDEGSLFDSQSATRYRILRRVGAGGMSTVFAAHDSQLGKEVALKLLKKDPLATDDSERRRLRMMREAQALKLLSHENVVRVFDVGDAGDQLFITMELIQGSALKEWLKEKPRSMREIIDVFVAAGRGLAAAHERGLIHRDFKPGNVLVSNDGRVVVTDFGLVRFGPEMEMLKTSAGAPPTFAAVLGAPLTAPGAVIGTPGYMAPEQIQGQSTDHRTDQFAFCVALYEALYGERPFAPSSSDELPPEIALALAVVQGEVRPEPAGSGVPAELRQILLRGLAPRPEDRFPSIVALLDELAAHEDKGSRGPVIALGALVVLLAIGSVVVIALPPRDPCADFPAVSSSAAGGELARFYEEWNVTRDVLCGPVFAKDLGARRTARACLEARLMEVEAIEVGQPSMVALGLTPPARCADDPRRVEEGLVAVGSGLDERALIEGVFAAAAKGDDLSRFRLFAALASRAGRVSLGLSASELYGRTGKGARAAHQLHALGHLYASLGRRVDAIACFDAMVLAASEVDGGRAHAAIGLEASGRLQLELGNYREAIALFERALALSDQPRIEANLATALSLAGEAPRALELARAAAAKLEAIDVEGGSALLVACAEVLRRGDAPGEAKRLLAQAITLAKTPTENARANYALGELALEENDPARAAEYFAAALPRAEAALPEHDVLIRDILTSMGIAELGTKPAAEHLERALALSRAHGDSGERSARIRFALARALIDQPDNKPRALQLAKSAIDELSAAGDTTRSRRDQIADWIAAVE